MSGKFALAAPPASGKVSRKERVSRSGRSTSFDTDELGHLSHVPGGANSPHSQPPAFPTIIETNPFETAAIPNQRPQPTPASSSSTGRNSIPQAQSSSAAPDDLFSFFDPLASAPKPTPAPIQQQQQRPSQPTSSQSQSRASDPFSAAFSNQLSFQDPFSAPSGGADSFDPFASSAPTFNLPRSPMKATPATSVPSHKSPTAAAQKAPESSSDESSSSDSDSDSDSSDSDSEEGSTKKKKKKGIATNTSSVAVTSNKTLANGSTPAVAAAATSGPSTTSSTASTMKVDVLAFMRKGTPFLKYGRNGYPHFRQFQLSDDNTRITWYSQNKKVKDTQIDIYQVDEIRFGQTTPNFARHPAPDLEKSSFSLMYDHGRSSLDVIAKDPNEFKIWTTGLQKLLQISRGGVGQLESLKTLVVDLGIQTTRRSSIDIIDARTGQSAASQASADVDDSRPRALSTGNKGMFKEVSKNFNNLKYKLNKRREELREHQFYTCPEYESMQTIMKRVQDSVNRIQEFFQDGEYPQADDEIWRAGVDLESLKNMMKAIKP